MGRLAFCRFWSAEIPAEICDLIVKLGKALPTDTAQLRSNNESDFIDESVRKTMVAYWDASHWINALASHYVRLANDESWNYKLSITQGVQFASYQDGGKYNWHKDEFDSPIGGNAPPQWQGLNRKLSVVINLSNDDEYEGGQLLFKDTFGAQVDMPEEYNQMRQKGSVIVFPAYIVHTVTPVTRGERFSLASWMLGPSFC